MGCAKMACRLTDRKLLPASSIQHRISCYCTSTRCGTSTSTCTRRVPVLGPVPGTGRRRLLVRPVHQVRYRYCMYEQYKLQVPGCVRFSRCAGVLSPVYLFLSLLLSSLDVASNNGIVSFPFIALLFDNLHRSPSANTSSMASKLSTAEWQSAKQKVASWIDNEERCVTAQRVCQTLNVSRLEASQLLEEIICDQAKGRGESETKFQITTCQREDKEEENVPVTVFRLRQSTTIIPQDSDASHNNNNNNNSCNIVAIASLQATESVATAHERDLMEWREMVADGRYQQQTKDDGAIQPADVIAPLKDAAPPSSSSSPSSSTKMTVEDDPSSSATSNLSSNRHKAFSGKAKKVTTAASFFGSKSKNGNSSSSTPAKSAITVASNNNNISSNSSQRAPQPTEAKENDKVQTNQVAPTGTGTGTGTAKASATSSRSSNNKPKSFGNADDFVADEEESDDEDKELHERKQKQVARRKAVQEANKQSEETTPVDEGDDDVDDDKGKVVGAMDAFATTAPKKVAVEMNNNINNNNNGTRQRKRRKKLVEETVMVNGYLRTETKAIWEDVPTDEEEEEKEQERQRVTKKPFKPSKPQQGMKQKSLMGFFAKK